jgi:hypothetical protein
MNRWYVSGTCMEYIQAIDVIAPSEEAALAAWYAKFPGSSRGTWSVKAANVDAATGYIRDILESLWHGDGYAYESGGYYY